MRRWFTGRIAALAPLIGAVVAGPAAAQVAPAKGLHLGVASCAGDNCHGAVERFKGSHVAQNEYLIWSQRDKHRKAFTALDSERGRRIAQNLGIGDPQHAAECLVCHADNAPPAQRGPRFQIADGVGCESCHGAASGWLGVHLSGASHAANLAAGLYPLEQPLARAERCLACHLGDDKHVINHRIMGAGHPPLTFELDTYTAVQPAHFHVDAGYVARKGQPDDIQVWAVGQAVDVNERMDALLDAKNAPQGIQPELVLFDCQSCHHSVTQLQWHARPSIGLPPGHLRLYDATATMLEIIAERVTPGLGAEFGQRLRALQQATTRDWNTVRRAAGAMQQLDARIIAALRQRRFGRDDAISLARTIASASGADADLDYSAAQQETMALGSILAAMKVEGFAEAEQIAAMNAALADLYKAIASDQSYRPDVFRAAMRGFAAKLPPK